MQLKDPFIHLLTVLKAPAGMEKTVRVKPLRHASSSTEPEQLRPSEERLLIQLNLLEDRGVSRWAKSGVHPYTYPTYPHHDRHTMLLYPPPYLVVLGASAWIREGLVGRCKGEPTLKSLCLPSVYRSQPTNKPTNRSFSLLAVEAELGPTVVVGHTSPSTCIEFPIWYIRALLHPAIGDAMWSEIQVLCRSPYKPAT